MSDERGMNPAEFANIAAAEREFWWYRGMRRILFGLLDPVAAGRPVARVLEAGCGTGHMSLTLSERYGWRMFPADLGWDGLLRARAYGLGRLAQSDVAALPFQDGGFDVVVSLDVIQHFPRGGERPALAEFERVLKPGGLLVLRVSALDLLRSRHSEFAGERQRFTRGRLLASLREHGFRIRRASYANALLMPVALAKFRLWEALTRAPAASGVRPVAPWLDRILYSALAIESVWLRFGGVWPLGQSLVVIAEKRD